MSSKKYGLQLRKPPGQFEEVLVLAEAFACVHLRRWRQLRRGEGGLSPSHKNIASLQKTQEQHKKALEEDPSVFDYDGVYDDMKEKIGKPKIQQQNERKIEKHSKLWL